MRYLETSISLILSLAFFPIVMYLVILPFIAAIDEIRHGNSRRIPAQNGHGQSRSDGQNAQLLLAVSNGEVDL